MMNNFTKDASVAKRVAMELRPLATYLDDHDAGRVPVNAGSYQAASQKAKILLAPHLENTHIQQLCVKSQALHEIFGNLLMEQKPEMAQDLERALEEMRLSPYWLQ
jgi:hypothetical protein